MEEDGVGGQQRLLLFSSCVVVYAERPPSSSSPPCGVYLVCVAPLSPSKSSSLCRPIACERRRERAFLRLPPSPPPLSDSQGRLGEKGRGLLLI